MLPGFDFGRGVFSDEVDREGVMSSCIPLTGLGFGEDVLSKEVVGERVPLSCMLLKGLGLKEATSPPLEVVVEIRLASIV